MQASAKNIKDWDCGSVGRTTEMKNDFDLMISLIQKRDKSSLKKLLNNKSVNILNISNDGWFALHEAVDLGYTDIVKLIIKFATKHEINVLQKWDQATTSRPKYSCAAFNDLLFLNVSIISTMQQTSFLRLAVQSQQIEMINIFIKLYKNKPNRFDRNLQLLRQTETIASIVLDLQSRLVDAIRCKTLDILEAIFESVTQPEVLHILSNAFPEFLEYRGGKLASGVMQMALN